MRQVLGPGALGGTFILLTPADENSPLNDLLHNMLFFLNGSF